LLGIAGTPGFGLAGTAPIGDIGSGSESSSHGSAEGATTRVAVVAAGFPCGGLGAGVGAAA
jgi:hypothetical protein